MKARMEKYNIDAPNVKRRTLRNERLYDEVQDMNIDYVNIDVNNAVDLSISSNTRARREDFQKQRELNKILPRNEIKEKAILDEVEPKEDRIYDIDEILKLARQNKLFEDKDKKRLINTEYNILTKLDIASLENEDMKKEDLRTLIDGIYEKEKPVRKVKVYPRKEEEKLLNDLFDDYDTKKNLEEELKIKEELSKNILENTPDVIENEDNEISVSKEEKETEKPISVKIENTQQVSDFIEVKEGKGLIVAIIIVSILILLTCGFFVYEYFFGI